MPPKVTDNHTTSAESLHAVEKETAIAAQRIVATYANDFLDAATLMCMLGVEPEGLIHRKVAADAAAEERGKEPEAGEEGHQEGDEEDHEEGSGQEDHRQEDDSEEGDQENHRGVVPRRRERD